MNEDMLWRLLAGWYMVAGLLAVGAYAGMLISFSVTATIIAVLIGWLLIGLIGIVAAFNVALWKGKM